ncbi:uncharacterized protein BXZ73DRAFT_104841 [Epithele typhae]|uniref:uncharacterized protein n=1 Tax=Epithele typhae TaxID=378194 RepID=UPI002008920E|nr:uncharacterized protein BXZ73DRAFT_104841 [Epithele typhae]KAH9920026.1 hypothetical protein BXZ73DRAFT_104841 [Epithele typhae]
MTTAPTPPLSLDDTLGAGFLGLVAASCFYGITVVQTFIYYKRNEMDPGFLKGLVFFLWILDSLHLALVVHAIYFYAVINFANPAALEVLVWSILIVSSLTVFGGSIAFPVKAFQLPSFTALPTISDILYVALGAGVVADLIIAASMCILLARRRTGFSKTDSTVRVLMIYSVNTGALTSLCALLCLITYASMPTNFVFIAFYFVLPKLFLNSMLATLNARRPLREGNSGAMMSFPLSVTQSDNAPMSFSSRPRYSSGYGGRRSFGTQDDPRSLHIQVETTRDTKADMVIEDVPRALEREAKGWESAYELTPVDHDVAIVV